MRLGVLDIGSNTGHLLVVDAFVGGPPVPAHSYREALRLAEHLDSDQAVTEAGIERLVTYVAGARQAAEDTGCAEIIAFATSAVRDAVNVDAVLAEVFDKTGVKVEVMSGDDEARLTFLAVRRWFGWSSGRLGVFDIGGGSLELAVGRDEAPDVASSVPLGAGRLSREWLAVGRTADDLRTHVRAVIAQEVGPFLRGGEFDHAVATSKTFRSLARILGAAPSTEGPHVTRILQRVDLGPLIDRLAGMTLDQISCLPGVSPDRAHQIHAGALVAEATMDLFDLKALEICPWALREGVLLDRIDRL